MQKYYTSITTILADLAALKDQKSQMKSIDLQVAENKARYEFQTHMVAAAELNLQTLRNVLSFLSCSWEQPRPASDLFAVMMRQPVFVAPAEFVSGNTKSLCVFSLFDPFQSKKVNYFAHFSLKAFSRDLSESEIITGDKLPNDLVEVGYFDFKAHRFVLLDDAAQRAEIQLGDLEKRLNAHFHLTGIDTMYIAELSWDNLFSLYRLLRALPLHESEHAFAEQVRVGLGDWLQAHKHGNEKDGIDGYVLGSYGYNGSTHSNVGLTALLSLYLMLLWANMAVQGDNPSATYESALSSVAFAKKLKNAQYELFIKSCENRKSPQMLQSLKTEIAALEKLLTLFPESNRSRSRSPSFSKIIFRDTRKKTSFGVLKRIVVISHKDVLDRVERVEVWLELMPTTELGRPLGQSSQNMNKKSYPAELFFDKTIIAI